MRLYKIGYHFNVYERGLARLSQIKPSDLDSMEVFYKQKAACSSDDTNINMPICGNLSQLKYKIKSCLKETKDEARSICHAGLLEKLFNELKFSDLKKLLGENNFYVYAAIDGLREKSEILNDTIYSNSIGKIGSDKWNGPLQVVRDLVGVSGGEFSGDWFREGGH